MPILAVLLIAVAVVVTVGILLEATQAAPLDVWGISLPTTASGVFLLGAATMLVFLLGLGLLIRSTKKARARRAEVKALQRERVHAVSQLEREKAELEEQLRIEREQKAHGGSAGSVGAVAADRYQGQAPDRPAGTARTGEHVDLTQTEYQNQRR